LIEVQYRRKRRIAVRLRPPVAETRSHGARVITGRLVQLRDRACEAGFPRMADGTRLVAIRRELLIIHQNLAEQLNLLDLIVRWGHHARQSLVLDGSYPDANLLDLTEDLRGEPRLALGITICAFRRRRCEGECPGHDNRRPYCPMTAIHRRCAELCNQGCKEIIFHLQKLSFRRYKPTSNQKIEVSPALAIWATPACIARTS
jgi:hypothetical protein